MFGEFVCQDIEAVDDFFNRHEAHHSALYSSVKGC